MISKDAQKALDDLGDYSAFAGASHDEVEAGIADEAKEWLIAYIASLEAQLADAQARLAGYEVGFDPKVKLPEIGQTVIAKEVRGDQPIYWDVEFIKGDDKSLWVNWAFAEPSDISEIARWFPLPGAKEEK